MIRAHLVLALRLHHVFRLHLLLGVARALACVLVRALGAASALLLVCTMLRSTFCCLQLCVLLVLLALLGLLVAAACARSAACSCAVGVVLSALRVVLRSALIVKRALVLYLVAACALVLLMLSCALGAARALVLRWLLRLLL